MLKSLLIGLDGSDDSHSVLEIGIRLAKRFDAQAVGVAVVDQPGILTSEAVLFARGPHWHALDMAKPLVSSSHHRAEQILDQFGDLCRVASVSWRTLVNVGTPYVQIIIEAQSSDLVLLGRQTHFDYGHELEADETLAKVIQDCPRPVIVVPQSLGGGESVVVAYDGSLQAARALFAFEALGLASSRNVHVVSVARGRQDAARHADRAVGFLNLHGIEATPHAVGTKAPTAEAILHESRRVDAGLLVMGACGQPVFREFFLGSVTRKVLKESSVPVFCYH